MQRHRGPLFGSRAALFPVLRSLRTAGMVTVLVVASGCAAPGRGRSRSGPSPEDAWAALREARPEPLPGAVRLGVADLTLLGRGGWSDSLPVPDSLGLRELVSLDLLRRRDVHWVEWRGDEPIGSRPPAGGSPDAQLILAGTWAPVDADSAHLDVHLTDALSGRVLRRWRTTTPRNADLVSLARAATDGCLRALAEMHRRPAWDDPRTRPSLMPTPYPGYRRSGVPGEAVVAFLRGLAAEDRRDWEEARTAYQLALILGGDGFYEPEVALARAARLRSGGSPGAS